MKKGKSEDKLLKFTLRVFVPHISGGGSVTHPLRISGYLHEEIVPDILLCD